MKKFFSLTLVLFATLLLASCVKVRNKAPIIEGFKDHTIELNGTFDPKAGVTVKDEDKDIELKVFGWNDDYTKQAGVYEVVYYAQDSKGLSTLAVSKVSVGETTGSPTLVGVRQRVTFYSDATEFDVLKGITAKDSSGADITEDITYKASDFDLTTEGVYGIVIFVEANDKATTKVMVLTVAEAMEGDLDKDRKIRLEFHHAMGAANTDLVKKYIKTFNEIYPNVEIVLPDSAGNYDTLKANTIANLSAGTAPNLVQSYPDHVAEYLNSGQVMNLDPYINNANYGLNGLDSIDDIITSYLEENQQYDAEGTFYSLPFNKSTEVLVYNKTAFDALGIDVAKLQTWQGIMEIAPLLLAYGRDTLKKENVVPVAYDSEGNGFITMTRQWGGKYTEIDFATGKGKYLWKDNANTIKALEYFKGYGIKSTNNPNGKGYFTLPQYWEQQYASTPFIAQQTFITIGSSAGVRHNMPSSKDFIVDTAPLPYNADMPENRSVIQQGTNVAIFSTGDNQIDLASWLFLKHLINTENTTDWAMNTGYIPVRNSAMDSKVYKDFLNKPVSEQNGSALGAKVTSEQRDYMFYDPAFPGSSRARANVGQALQRILLGDGNITASLNDAYDSSMVGQ